MKKSGSLRKIIYFIFFLVGITLLVLLIKFNWDFEKVVEFLVSYKK